MYKTILCLVAGTFITHAATGPVNEGNGNTSPTRSSTPRVFVFPDPTETPDADAQEQRHHRQMAAAWAEAVLRDTTNRAKAPDPCVSRMDKKHNSANDARSSHTDPNTHLAGDASSSHTEPNTHLSNDAAPSRSIVHFSSSPHGVSHHMDFMPAHEPAPPPSCMAYWAEFPGAGYVPFVQSKL